MIIYKAENIINGKVYIGKTVGLLCNRKATHKKGAIGYCYNSAFHNAIRKHGWENFKWEILAETDSESKLNALEKFYISAYRKMGICYNMTNGGEGQSGIIVSQETREKLSQTGKGRKHSEEFKLKASERMKGENNPAKREDVKKKISETSKNRIVSEETKEKMRIKSTGKKHTDEARKKISDSAKGRKHSESTKLKFKEQRTGKPHPHKGHIVTPEEIIKRNKTRIMNLKNRQLNV